MVLCVLLEATQTSPCKVVCMRGEDVLVKDSVMKYCTVQLYCSFVIYVFYMLTPAPLGGGH